MKYGYLLSTGIMTTKVEEYIIDLFKLYLTVYPGDIPHLRRLGFDFILSGIAKSDLEKEVKTRVNQLVSKIQEMVPNKKYEISIKDLDLIDEETVRLVIDVNSVSSEDIIINLYD